MALIDKLIVGFDQALRAVMLPAISRRPMPGGDILPSDLSQDDKRKVACLMRVNHSGEICAQALYQGQALTARNPEIQLTLKAASLEEVDHLAWCESRLKELNARKSLLNPFLYGTSFLFGAFSGLWGDRWNLGFLVETERQVEGHLEDHLNRLPLEDKRTRAILEQMKADEASHVRTGVKHGAAELPFLVKRIMKLTSRVMTHTTYWV